MITPETVVPPPAEPVVANEITTLTEQETTRLLKDLKITVESFKELFSEKNPALCHALEVVLDYCQKQRTDTFTTRDLIKSYGLMAICYRKQNTGRVIVKYQESIHRRRLKQTGAFTSNIENVASFIQKIVELIASNTNKDKFPVTFNRSPDFRKGEQGQPVTFWVMRNS